MSSPDFLYLASQSARRRQLQSADVTQRLVEILAGIKVIKGFRAEQQEHEGFRLATRRLFRRGMTVVKNRVMSRSLVDALNNASGIGVLLLGLALVLGRRWGLTLGDLAAFSAVSGTLYKPLRSLARGWSRFVVDGRGVRCVDDHVWVTAAETCECVMAHLAAGDDERARTLFEWAQAHRRDSGAYDTGIVYPDRSRFPDGECSTYTAAAVVLAADALAATGPASGLFADPDLLPEVVDVT